MPTLDKYRPEPCLSLAEEAWRSIERALSLDEPDLGLRCRIARYIDLYFLGPTAKSPVKANDLRKQLEELRKDAAALQSHHALRFTLDVHDREVLKSKLSTLIEGADEALRLVPKETKPKHDHYENLILALAHTYRNVTGNKPTVVYNSGSHKPDPADPNKETYAPYGSKFLDFVVTVLAAIDDQYAKIHNNQSLGQKINRSLRTWRKIVGVTTQANAPYGQ